MLYNDTNSQPDSTASITGAENSATTRALKEQEHEA